MYLVTAKDDGVEQMSWLLSTEKAADSPFSTQGIGQCQAAHNMAGACFRRRVTSKSNFHGLISSAA